MKKLFTIGTLLLLAALLVACGGTGNSSSAAVKAGEELFNETVVGSNAGCVTCHSLEPGMVIVGPSLAGFSHEAEDEGKAYGMSAEEFVRESILDPNAVISEDYPADTMPTNWGEVLTKEQVDNLVAFLLSLE